MNASDSKEQYLLFRTNDSLYCHARKDNDKEETLRTFQEPLDCKERKGSERTEFQRDRDRIIHTLNFRKLANKTQVFIAPHSAEIRSRLTHTIEVYQISSDMGMYLNLNSFLIEAIAFGHDIGHTPFGHAGEEALMLLMEKYGGFSHYANSVRVLDNVCYDIQLFESFHTTGLNLTYAVREGIYKHAWLDKPNVFFSDLDVLRPNIWGSLESQVVHICDSLAYLCHDIEDLMHFGIDKIIRPYQIKNFLENAEKNYKIDGINKEVKNLFYEILCREQNYRVKLLMRDLRNASRERLNKMYKISGDKIFSERLIDFSKPMRVVFDLFYLFFRDYIYEDIRVVNKNNNAKNVINALFNFLFDYYKQNVDLIPFHISNMDGDRYNKVCKFLIENNKSIPNLKEFQSAHAAADVVSSLTDSEAIDYYKKLESVDYPSNSIIDYTLNKFPNKEKWFKMIESYSQQNNNISKLILCD